MVKVNRRYMPMNSCIECRGNGTQVCCNIVGVWSKQMRCMTCKLFNFHRHALPLTNSHSLRVCACKLSLITKWYLFKLSFSFGTFFARSNDNEKQWEWVSPIGYVFKILKILVDPKRMRWLRIRGLAILNSKTICFTNKWSYFTNQFICCRPTRDNSDKHLIYSNFGSFREHILGLFHCLKKNDLTHCGWVTQICVFNTVKLGTSASSP